MRTKQNPANAFHPWIDSKIESHISGLNDPRPVPGRSRNTQSILQVQVTTGQEKEDAERGLTRIKEFMSVLGPHLQRVLPVEDDDVTSDDTRDAENDKSADNTR